VISRWWKAKGYTRPSTCKNWENIVWNRNISSG